MRAIHLGLVGIGIITSSTCMLGGRLEIEHMSITFVVPAVVSGLESSHRVPIYLGVGWSCRFRGRLLNKNPARALWGPISNFELSTRRAAATVPHLGLAVREPIRRHALRKSKVSPNPGPDSGPLGSDMGVSGHGPRGDSLFKVPND